jgi:hypothetical protein
MCPIAQLGGAPRAVAITNGTFDVVRRRYPSHLGV